MRGLILTAILLKSISSFGQEDQKSPFTISGYLEIYYLYDFNKPQDHNRPHFMYSHNRANEFNLNLGFIKADYATRMVRANFGLMTGTYVNANLDHEPGVLKSIFEANAGVRLSEEKDVWIDAGIFPSHIGFESAIGKDCWNLTRSILADNSPYYEAGAKVSYTTDNSKWSLSGLILNGWQRIQMVYGNSLLSFGTQLTFKPSSSVLLNYSSFIGTDKPDSARLMRYFNNFYGIFKLSEIAGLTIGLDYGLQEKNVNEGFNMWWSPVVIFRLKLSHKMITALRGEYYYDKQGVIVDSPNPMGFKVSGISFNLDYQIHRSAIWRIEARHFGGVRAGFVRKGRPVDDNTSITTSLAVTF